MSYISREEALKPYMKLNDSDVVSVYLIKKSLMEQDSADVKFLTDEEKQIIIESALKELRQEIAGKIKDLIAAHDWGNTYGMTIALDMINEKIEGEE